LKGGIIEMDTFAATRTCEMAQAAMEAAEENLKESDMKWEGW